MVEWIMLLIVGLCIGSFLNVAILRIPKDESISFPASHCTTCLHPLSWYHNIPVVSWMALRGKCAFCHSPISTQYPIIEILSAFLYLLTYLHAASFIKALLIGTIFSLLLALSLIDLRYKAVPDMLSFPALFLAFSVAFWDSLLYGLVFFGGFSLLRMLLSSLLKKEVMGEADSIIAGIIGALLGIKLGCFAIYLSAVIALIAFMVVRKKGYELPYIPFLSSALLITWLCDSLILTLLETLYA